MADGFVGDPVELANGNLIVPQAVEDPATGVVGDRFIEITPDHADYDAWMAFIKAE